MAKQDPTPEVDGPTPEAVDTTTDAATPRVDPKVAAIQAVSPHLRTDVNFASAPGTAETVLATRQGYSFSSGVEDVPTIEDSGTRVAKTKIDAVMEAAAPQGEGFIFDVTSLTEA